MEWAFLAQLNHKGWCIDQNFRPFGTSVQNVSYHVVNILKDNDHSFLFKITLSAANIRHLLQTAKCFIGIITKSTFTCTQHMKLEGVKNSYILRKS